MELFRLTAHELSEKITKQEVTAQEVTTSVFQRIETMEPKVKAYVTLLKENALQQAETIDQKIKTGEKTGALAGIPIAIKDNMNIKGVKSTCSSKILNNFISPYNATVIDLLKKQDMVFIGKTNMDEFAMGSSTETSYFGKTYNPWNLETIPGGSSGGSAASVAADEAILALGSDTGGSIRQPASCCGIVGLKPTYGRVSRFGLVAFASSLDQIGPLTKDVQDAALLMNAIAVYDNNDSTSVNIPTPDYTKSLIKDLTGLKIGIPKEYFVAGMDKEVEQSVREAINLLEKQGAKIIEISLPHTEYCLAVYYILAPSEASANLARYDGVKYGYRTPEAKDLLEQYEKTRGEGFGPEVKRRIMLGTYALSSGYYDAYYLKAQKVRTLIKNDFDEAFKNVDAIVTPTAPTAAFKIGEKTDDPLQMYLSDIFTISVNLAGIPALSMPCGFTRNKMPIGLQIMAKHFAEETIFKVAYAYEQNTAWHKEKPKL
ncbi:MAG: Asp-tRNA(Asn)/Glu-tRNA(Gln) amidotransferase subunit GatA [bacterium]|nr:Asp-tRNA(Asn)/Glu-tRNA(Gln) amidotransferase subunit GatA [bacterium]MDD5354340.1 Asp-tRNA(Asn)/Glu-tRNA(Gln) amidotransferase subunit GatA [bacterium]MDD5757069.1 Asp-tRNA(Asn)/Glu-tRNA(Gln) amidotransferase subunit GatA [bacterium]